MKRIIRTALVALLGLSLIPACGGDSTSSPAETDTSQQDTAQTDTVVADTAVADTATPDTATPDTTTPDVEDVPPVPVPVSVSLAVVDGHAYEGGTVPAVLTIGIPAPVSQDLTVLYEWAGTAKVDEDFVLSCTSSCTVESAIIPAGETQVSLTLTPTVTPDLEAQEWLRLTLKIAGPIMPAGDPVTVYFHEFGPSPGNVYYLSTTGSDENTGTEAAPFGSLKHAVTVLTAGDTLYIEDGTYTAANFTDDHGPTGDKQIKNGVLAAVDVSGTPDAWITIAAAPDGNNTRPRFRFDGAGGLQFKKDVSYVRVEGLEFEGPNASITQEWAHQHRWSKENFYNGRGIYSWGPVHHIVVRDCYVHHTPGSGIRFNKSDYIQVENSVVSNTTWWSASAESAIVIATSVSIDQVDAVKFLYANNRVYNNWNFMEFCSNDFKDSTEDAYGNCDHYSGGIIDGQGLYVTRNNDTYLHGRMRFENNIAFNNGFGGVVYHKTDRGELFNNLLFMNGAYPGKANYSGLSVNTVDGLTIANNIIWAGDDNDYGLKNNGNTSNVVATNNVTIGKSQFGDSSDNTVLSFADTDAAQFFVKPADLATARPDPTLASGDNSPAGIDAFVQSLGLDFHALKDATELLDKGTATNAPPGDMEGVVRPQGAGVDIGPYEIADSN